MTLITLPSGGVLVESELDGHLYCRTHQSKVWDKDVKQVITEGLDVEHLWALVTEDDRSGPIPVMVPYIPEMGCWAKVEVGALSNGGALAQVISLETGEVFRLGIIFPGEGRSVLRQMIHNWFIPLQFDQVTAKPMRHTCKATSHNPVRQAEMQNNLHDDSRKWGELWLLTFTGMCYACTKLKEEVSSMVPSF